MTAIGRVIAALFRMDERTWERHANPWSVWTRMASLPLMLAVIWSHTTLGWWVVVPAAATAAWLWLNPRLFPPPASTRSWASRAVLGERLWVDPARRVGGDHRTVATLTSAVAAVGGIAAVGGAVANDIGWTLSGAAVCYLGKLWFLDRMVWLFEDARRGDPAVAAWLR